MVMDERHLVAIIERKLDRSLNDQGGGVSDVREDNFDRYYGLQYGTEKEGFSSYVSRECLEVVEWALPSVMRVMMQSGKQVIQFDPVGPEDEDQARQETEAINYWLLRRNRGFMTLYELVKDALMNPVSYAKVWIDERTTVTNPSYEGIFQGEVDELLADRKNELLSVHEHSILIDGQEIPVFDVEIERTETRKNVTFSSLAPEEVLIERGLTTLDMDMSDFICHRARRSMSELVEMGIDPEDLRGLSIDSEQEFDDERTNRLFYEEEHPTGADEDGDDTPTQHFWVHEIWGQFDWDEDDVAEMRHILMIGHEIFENETTEYQPIVALSAIPIPHKHTGMSYIETVKDLQLISSDLHRQLLDNVYNQTINKKYVQEAAILETNETLDQILDPDSEFVITRLPPANAISFEERANIIPEILQAIEIMNERPQMRSGVSPQLSLDPNVLRESTEGAFAEAMNWANQRLELLVRIIAEIGLKPIALKAHQLLRTEVDEAQTIKLSGKWAQVSPQEWFERTDMTVTAGLGHATETETVNGLLKVLELQKEAISIGLAGPKQIYTTLDRLVAASKLGNASSFFIDPDDPEYRPPEDKQDPAAIVAQAELIKAQTEQKTGPGRLQVDLMKAQTDQQTKLALEQQKLQLQLAEVRLKERELEIREREIEAGIDREDDVSDADISLKTAQAMKTRKEAQAIDIDNSDTASELISIVRGKETKSSDAKG